MFFISFFFNDTATTEIYTLSLHDALPISNGRVLWRFWSRPEQDTLRRRQLGRVIAAREQVPVGVHGHGDGGVRSEEHTSELQSHSDLVCRLLLEKKKKSVFTAMHTIYAVQ